MECKLCKVVGLSIDDFDRAREIVGNDHESMCIDCAISINDANLSHDQIYKVLTEWMNCAELAELLWMVDGDEMNTVWMLHNISKNSQDMIDKIYEIRSGKCPASPGFEIRPNVYTQGFLHGISFESGDRKENPTCQK